MSDEDIDILAKELYTGELDPEEIKDEIWQTKLMPVENCYQRNFLLRLFFAFHKSLCPDLFRFGACEK